MLRFLLSLFVVLTSAVASVPSGSPKLILSLLIDDLGSADLGYTGSGIHTPALDALIAGGVELTSFYVQPICTPSRGAFLTGRYPLATGLQGKQTVQQGCAWGLDVTEQTFPSALQEAGWATAMVGKMHLGGDRWARTPTFRGFDSFLGYYYGAEDYYTHKLAAGYDLRLDVGRQCGAGCSVPIARTPPYNGSYSTIFFGARVETLIAEAGARAGPTYIHFAPQSVHAPNEAPEASIAPYRPIFGPDNPVRAVHAGALATLDAAIAGVVAAIERAGLANATLIVASADNGGPLGPTGDGTMASNYPRRGGKHSLYEGGVNAMAFAWGPSWLRSGSRWAGLTHITDVGPTILEAAGVAAPTPLPGRPVHGRSFWGPLRAGTPSARDEVIINVDYTADGAGPQAAIVTPDGWKLILGRGGDATCDWWSDRVGERDTNVSAARSASAPPTPPHHFSLTRPSTTSPFWPLANMTPALYNLRDDPREMADVASQHTDVVAALTARIAAWGVQAVAVVENATADPYSNPTAFGGDWTPWLPDADGDAPAR